MMSGAYVISNVGHCNTVHIFKVNNKVVNNEITNLLRSKQRCCLRTSNYSESPTLSNIWKRASRYNYVSMCETKVVFYCLFTFLIRKLIDHWPMKCEAKVRSSSALFWKKSNTVIRILGRRLNTVTYSNSIKFDRSCPTASRHGHRASVRTSTVLRMSREEQQRWLLV